MGTETRHAELSAAAHEAHAALTDSPNDEKALELLVLAAKRALHHFERLRGDREDSPLMWDLRRSIRAIERGRKVFEAWP